MYVPATCFINNIMFLHKSCVKANASGAKDAIKITEYNKDSCKKIRGVDI